MKGQHLAFVVVLLLSACIARGQTTTPGTGFPETEYSSLLACEGMTDTAWTSATQKLKGVTLADAKKYYDGKLEGPQKDLALHTVDRVYSDSFTSSWDYAVSVYGECAENIPNIQKIHATFASSCMQNSMIAMTASDDKSSGLPVEKVYERFSKFPNLTPQATHAIIDRVYAGSRTRADSGSDEWKSCMELPVKLANSPPPPQAKPDPLTDTEVAGVAACVPAADLAWYLAEQKAKGVPLEDVKKRPESQPDSLTKSYALRLADAVYGESIRFPGVYAIRFFDVCARKTASGAPNRLGMANRCLSNAHIAAVANYGKKSGIASDRAYEPYAENFGTSASTIIDRVYRSPASDEDAGVREWKTCMASFSKWNEEGDEVLLAATPSGYHIGFQSAPNTAVKVVGRELYPAKESVDNWTEKLSVEIFPGLNDSTPTEFQKAIQAPSKTCKDGKVLSTSVGQDNGYAYSLWAETCPAVTPTGQTEFKFYKAIQGNDNFYLVSRTFRLGPSQAQIEQSGTYLASVTVCDSKRSGHPCPTTDVWRP